MKKVIYNGLTFEPYIKRDQIQGRIEELAGEITAEYAGRRPLFLCVLNGAFPFASVVVSQRGAGCGNRFCAVEEL